MIARDRRTNRKVLVLKLAVVAAVLCWMARHGLVSLATMSRCLAHVPLLVAASVLLVSQTLLCIARWRLLVAAHGVVLGFRRAAELTLIGMFFNVALPGSVTGDFVKAYYVAGESGASDARIVGSVVFDRLIGVSALVLAAAIAVPFADAPMMQTPCWTGIRAGLAGAATGVAVLFVYLVVVRDDRDPLLRLFRAAERVVPRVGPLVRVHEGTRLYSRHPRIVLAALGLSGLVHLCNAVAVMLLARSLGEPVPAIAGMIVVPLGLIASALPILPMGIGAGHAAFAFLFLLAGSARGADVFTLNLIYSLCCGALGGLAYLRFRRLSDRMGATPTDEITNSSDLRRGIGLRLQGCVQASASRSSSSRASLRPWRPQSLRPSPRRPTSRSWWRRTSRCPTPPTP